LAENFSVFLDSQLTSCIASQVVIALHFVVPLASRVRLGVRVVGVRTRRVRQVDVDGAHHDRLWHGKRRNGVRSDAYVGSRRERSREAAARGSGLMEGALSVAAALAAVPAAASVALPRVCYSLRRDA
jgi:hypothetical protein